MIVNRAALAGPPAQNQTFKSLASVNKIPGVPVFSEMDVRLELGTIYFQIRDESAQVGQLHLLRCVLELIDGADKVHVVRSVLP